ncbi:MAG: CoA transferase, partial [Chloroflexi bacterium]|nr:CoA transferase [Chloroflexota bacterium]
LEDSRFATLEGRKAHAAELEQAIGDWTSSRDSFEVMRSLQEAGVPAGVVQKGSDVWSDPQLAHRGHFRMLNHTECGPMPYETLPFHLSETPAEMSSAAPLVGEHNLSILEEFLGMPGSEVGVLLEEGVLETS